MADPTGTKPPFRKQPLRWLLWWLRKKEPTNLNAFVIAIVVWLLTGAGLTALIGYVFKLLVPHGQVPGYTLAVVAGIFLTLASVGTWLITRQIYRERLYAKDVESEAGQNEIRALRAELELARTELQSVEPSRVAAIRLGMYFDHVYTLVEGLIRGDVVLQDLSGANAKHWLCDTTRTILEEAVGTEFTVSVWIEHPPTRVGEAVQQYTPLSDRRTFEVVAAPRHTEDECEAFAKVRIDPSWIKYNHRLEQDDPDNPKFRAYGVDRMDLAGLRGPDIDAFKRFGYDSVRATSFRRDPVVGYIVVLSKTPQPFSVVEDRYLLWLRHALELDHVISNGERLPGQA